MLQKPQIGLHLLYTPKIPKLSNEKLRNSEGIYSIKTSSTIDYDKLSTRLYYKRRTLLYLKPLLIISYDGILGFTRDQRFHLRPKIDEFFKKIKNNYQIVVVK